MERGAKLYVEKMCYTWEGFERQTRRPRADMPRYSSKFVSDQELADIHAWLSTIRPGPKAAEIPLLGVGAK